LVLLVVACGKDDGGKSASQATTAPTQAATAPAAPAGSPGAASFQLVPAPTGRLLSATDIAALAAQFTQNPLQGGQVAPRLYKPVTEDVSIFLQFDRPNPAEARSLRYVGISVKGVFCAETQPDKAFTHFHRLTAPTYAEGHGGPPGTPGYWLMWVAADTFEAQGRRVSPGVDYDFSPTPPPSCGANVPAPNFEVPGFHITHDEWIMPLASLFNENPLIGGQIAPRLYKWVNEQVTIFLQFDRSNPSEASKLRYIGISVNGEFCKSKQPHTDFTHLHRPDATAYAEGHGGPPGTRGFWLLWVATDSFEAQGRNVTPGVDRAFSPTPPPDC
ncbi:MAG: hypothetical protein AB7U18_17660, partial [Dehalococcoidia bacterium]